MDRSTTITSSQGASSLRRWSACLLAGMHFVFCTSVAWAQIPALPDYSPDLTGARALIGGQVPRSAIIDGTIANELGLQDAYDLKNRATNDPDRMGIAILGGHATTSDAHRAANVEKINTCKSASIAGYTGLTDKQKTECVAILTAAQITYTPNPYLDPSSPTALSLGDMAALRNREAQGGALVSSGAVSSPLVMSSNTACVADPARLTNPPRQEWCSIEARVTENVCLTPISVTVNAGSLSSTRQPFSGSCSTQICADEASCLGGGVLSTPLSGASEGMLAGNPMCEPQRACTTQVVGEDAEGNDITESVCEGDGNRVCTITREFVVGQDDEGNDITQSACVEEKTGFTCWKPDEWNTDGCSGLASSPLCSQTGNEAVTQLVSGQPVGKDVEYQCISQRDIAVPGATKCTTNVCVGGSCFDATRESNDDLASAAVGMEMLREAGVYLNTDNESDPRFFKGIQDKCRKPTGIGIGTNCCRASGADLESNRGVLPTIASNALWGAVSSAGAYTTWKASSYVYDFMFTHGNDWMVESAFNAWGKSWDPTKGFSAGFSSYGFSVSALIEAPTVGGLPAASEMASSIGSMLPSEISGAFSAVSSFWKTGEIWSMSTSIGGMPINLSFNVYTLALQVAIQVISSLMTCSLDEKMLSARRGGGLCAKTGEYCSKKIKFIGCIQKKEVWCCWNSRLAQTIALQGGRGQLGVGTGQLCQGFTPDQIAAMDFSSMDLSRFKEEMLASMTLPTGVDLNHMRTAAGSTAANGSPIDPAATAAGAPADMSDYVSKVIQMRLQP